MIRAAILLIAAAWLVGHFPHLVAELAAAPVVWGFLFNCCCTSCTFFSDDFSTNDISNYDQLVGSWSISGGMLSISSSNALLEVDPGGVGAQPNGDANTKISVTVNISTDGDTARIILSQVEMDTNNYWFAEVKAGTGAYIRLYQRISGVNHLKDFKEGITLSTGTFAFCASIHDSQTFRASVGSDCVKFKAATASFSDDGYGLGTGARTGTVTFDDFSASVTSASCTPCPDCNTVDCPSCLNTSNTPYELEVVLAGISGGTCANCGTYNGTYILPQEPVGGSNCCYAINLPSNPCDTTPGDIESILTCYSPDGNGTDTDIICGIGFGAGFNTPGVNFGGEWALVVSGKPIDCSTSPRSLTFQTVVGQVCTTSASTCTVTALY